ncbi:unnamed protein product [Trichobilharzia regenti]|nr:unnamed protein product [Trichobilharzia regenti]
MEQSQTLSSEIYFPTRCGFSDCSKAAEESERRHLIGSSRNTIYLNRDFKLRPSVSSPKVSKSTVSDYQKTHKRAELERQRLAKQHQKEQERKQKILERQEKKEAEEREKEEKRLKRKEEQRKKEEEKECERRKKEEEKRKKEEERLQKEQEKKREEELKIQREEKQRAVLLGFLVKSDNKKV